MRDADADYRAANVRSCVAGVETKFKSRLYPVLISTATIPELHAVAVEAAGLRVGAACPLSVLDETLKQQIKVQPGECPRKNGGYKMMKK